MDQVLDIDGIATRCRSAGSGPEVLVLHGWGASIEAVDPIVRALAPSCAVHAPDLPGHGQTGPPPEPWGPREYAEWTRALIAALGLTRPSIVGHSHGGRVAIQLAADRPELVDKLLLIDAAGVRPPRGFRWYRRVALAKLAKHVLRRLGRGGNAVADRVVGRVASGDYADSDPVMRPTFVRLVNVDLTPRLPEIRSPTLLIWGDHDEDTPLRDGETMERSIPDAGLVVFEGAGHFAYADQPQRFARVATHFLAPPAAAPETASVDVGGRT